MQLPKAYNPSNYEDEIYKKWEESGYFNPDNLPCDEEAEKFVISMPPPNATGVLHVGHILGLAVQDTLIRYHRMKGNRALWVPGVDHAAIATQNVVEKQLKKEGTSRHELGREKLVERTNKYALDSKATIENQTRKMGSSCDWSREEYTMSDQLNKAVGLQFESMYKDGLIYRGDRIVNWCPRCQSTLSDDEVEYVEQKTKLYTFKYTQNFPMTIATTRPESKLGDTAVAVHPDDEKYKQYMGQEFEIDFIGIPLKLKIIADKEVDPKFGTGAVGVTPAHSPIDWKMAEENDLRIIKVVGQDGKILNGFGDFSGLKVSEARVRVVEKLKQTGLLEKEEETDNNLSICYRCNAPIEPLPSLQWFVAVDKEFKIKNQDLINKFGKDKTTLKEISRWAVESGEIKIIPERFEKVYFHWMNNLRDWCISRQIWFGHRIPAWYKITENTKSQKIQNHNNTKIRVQVESPGSGWEQDPDTLDTWFSSALWTWSTLLDKNYQQYDDFEKWFTDSPDFKKFHPTNVMETMHDILFFWVARMIIMTYYTLGEKPFETVYLHGMVCDKYGKKMSKSNPETCIEPIEISQKYGTDALRLSLIVGNSAGNKLSLSEQKIAGFRNFANKLWNIGRFIQFKAEGGIDQCHPDEQDTEGDPEYSGTCRLQAEPKTLADKWIASRMNNLIKEVTEHLENFQFSLAGERLYNFTWHELADWYVEIAKIQNNQNTQSLITNYYLLLLKLLHPFTPFVTEKIWEYFQPKADPPLAEGPDKMLMIEKWPLCDRSQINQQAEQDFGFIQELITSIRSWRKSTQDKEPPAQGGSASGGKEILKIQIGAGLSDGKLVEEQRQIIEKLARVELEVVERLSEDKDFEVGNVAVKVVSE